MLEPKGLQTLRALALAPEEFFDRILDDIRKYSQRETFADDVCVVGMQIRNTEAT